MVVKVLGSSFLFIGKYLKRTNEKKQIMGKLFFFFFLQLGLTSAVNASEGRGGSRVTSLVAWSWELKSTPETSPARGEVSGSEISGGDSS